MSSSSTVCVTGASGFIASWIVAKLLRKGYRVHGTVRDPAKCGYLRELEGAAERLTLFKADVLDSESMRPAIQGCSAVFHTACPVAFSFQNADDVLLPAIKGTQNVLQMCLQEKVKRVVMTSSSTAVVENPNHPKGKIMDESCWTDSEYCKEMKVWYKLAKTESEKFAWNFAQEHAMDLVTVLPVYVLGPLLQPALNATSEMLVKYSDGSKESCPNSYISVVDVRDVADVHILAYEKPEASGRYFCLSATVKYEDIVNVIKQNFSHLRCPKKCDAGPVQNVAARSNQKLKKEITSDLIAWEKSVVDAIQSLIAAGYLPKES